jgi:hypothetical protein
MWRTGRRPYHNSIYDLRLYAAVGPPNANSAITWTAGGKQSKQLDVLFVQNAKNVTID